MIFIGWSLATVGGMPLGGYVAHEYGWRVAYGIVAAMSLVAMLAVALTLPGGVRIPRLRLASWISVATSPALLLVLLVTVLNGTGQFTFFTYLNPSLKASLGASAALLTFVLAWYGVSATLGNLIASRFVGRLGTSRSALVTLLAMAVGLTLWGAGAGTLWIVLVAGVLWGLGTFATNSIQQARLAGLAPDLTSASIALNTSLIYLGQALGSGLGGVLINDGYLPFLHRCDALGTRLAANSASCDAGLEPVRMRTTLARVRRIRPSTRRTMPMQPFTQPLGDTHERRIVGPTRRRSRTDQARRRNA